MLGTTLVLKGVTRELIRDPLGAVYSHKAPNGDWLPGGASSTGAGAISRDFPGADLDELNRRAAGARAGRCAGLPAGVGGRAVPVRRTAGPRVPPRRTRPTTATTSPRVLQGVAFVERLCFDYLDLLGAPLDGDLVLTGGATKSAYWCQLRADILGRPVTLPDTAEAARSGMAVLAASPGRDAADVAAEMVRIREVIEPRPDARGRFDEPYLRFVAELADRGWLAARRREPRPRKDQPMTYLVLVRHGETVWHAENRYAGFSDVALTPRGREQAAQLAGVGADRPPGRRVGVPAEPRPHHRAGLRRCRRPAAADRRAAARARLRRGRGADLGRDGRAASPTPARPSAPTRWPTTCPAARTRSRPPTGSPRACTTSPQQHPDGRVLVVAHTTAIRLALCRLIGVPLAEYRRLFPFVRNCGLTELRLARRPGRLLQFNTPLDRRLMLDHRRDPTLPRRQDAPLHPQGVPHDPCARRRRPLRPTACSSTPCTARSPTGSRCPS